MYLAPCVSISLNEEIHLKQKDTLYPYRSEAKDKYELQETVM